MAERPPNGSGSSDDFLTRFAEGVRRAAEGLGKQLGESFPAPDPPASVGMDVAG